MSKTITSLLKGAWSALTAYTNGDIVENDGSSYVCRSNHTNQEPPNATYWQLLAQAGINGTNGTNGEVTFVGVATLTNKRITRRAPATTQSATPTINTDNTDVAHITGLAQAITSMTTNLTGTPVEGDMLRIDFTDDGTARAITWGAKFEASGNVPLPTTTVLGVRLDVGFIWNTVSSKWRCVATA